MSYTDACDPITMYCLRIFVVVYCKQCCLQTNKYDQSLRGTDIYIVQNFITIRYFVFELREFNLKKKKEKEKMNKTPYHSPIHL